MFPFFSVIVTLIASVGVIVNIIVSVNVNVSVIVRDRKMPLLGPSLQMQPIAHLFQINST